MFVTFYPIAVCVYIQTLQCLLFFGQIALLSSRYIECERESGPGVDIVRKRSSVIYATYKTVSIPINKIYELREIYNKPS